MGSDCSPVCSCVSLTFPLLLCVPIGFLNLVSSLIITKQSGPVLSRDQGARVVAPLSAVQEREIRYSERCMTAHHLRRVARRRSIASAVTLRKDLIPPSPTLSTHTKCISAPRISHHFHTHRHFRSNGALLKTRAQKKKLANFPLLTADGSPGSLSVCR